MELAELAGGIRLSMSDVELCVRNARRLRKDARRTSPGTRLALEELALEELAKGSMVMFRIYIQAAAAGRLMPPRAGGVGGVVSKGVTKLLESRADLLSDAALKEAFWNHDIKLDHVALMIDFLELTMPAIAAARQVDTRGLSPATRLFGFFARWERLRRFGIKYLSDTLARMRAAGVDDLDSLGKTAIYVGLDRQAAKCTPPTADYDLIELLGTFNMMFEGSLRTGIDRWRRDNAGG